MQNESQFGAREMKLVLFLTMYYFTTTASSFSLFSELESGVWGMEADELEDTQGFRRHITYTWRVRACVRATLGYHSCTLLLNLSYQSNGFW